MSRALRGYRCSRCGATWAPDARRWRCDCGGGFVLDDEGGGDAPAPVSLGAGSTPEVPVVAAGRRLRAKLEFLAPTLSFKDRGAEVLVGLAVAVGAERLVADSSGNAGTAIAAHAAHADLPAEVFVAASTSAPKLAQTEAHGAAVVRIDGTREDVAAAAVERVRQGDAFYASHVHNPWFWEGVSTMIDELDPLPDTLLLPLGNGTLVLGALAGLRRRGAVGRCRIVAVQASACAPIAAAFAAGADDVAPVVGHATAAEGIAIAAPPRGANVLAAVRATGGRVVTVDEPAIVAAGDELAAQGLYVEPTAAACVAGAHALTDDDGEVVVPLCGAGLKSA